MTASIQPSNIEILATVCFSLAVLHTFSIGLFQHLATKFREGSVGENLFHLLGEVEIVFGFWAGVFLTITTFLKTPQYAIDHIESTNFTEAAFVFVIMAVAATKPILNFAKLLIEAIARVIPAEGEICFFIAALTVGPILGSFITEPAAMTVTALLLRDRFFSQDLSTKFKYLTLGVLFVNISIGGVLTPFAAPPVLMVAKTWNWDLPFLALHFGWKACTAIAINTAFLSIFFSKELRRLKKKKSGGVTSPVWLQLIHLTFLAAIVFTSHHPAVFMGIFLFFLGVASITKEFQEELKLRESLLVGFFLAGLVVLGGYQTWWLKPVIAKLTDLPLFLSATALTAFTDNAALTFLGSQVPNVTEGFKYAIVSGAIAGGGLTVIANAPNLSGFSILWNCFGEEGIDPIKLFLGALIPTVIAMSCLWLLPQL